MGKRDRLTFDDWYKKHLGSRWQELREALTREQSYHELKEGLLQPYYLDESSYVAAKALGVMPGENVLDMCAAPGGKTLIMALDLAGNGRLIANDRSSARRLRLKRVLDMHLRQDTRRLVEITGHDARKWGMYEKDRYDRVLLDAPCSSERHVISSPRHLAQWSPARTKHLSIQAYTMLAAAYDTVRPGGIILYVTCALSPAENDGVVGKLIQKRATTLSPVKLPWGEPTAHGWQIWPDTSDGRGPIYVSRLTKNPSNA